MPRKLELPISEAAVRELRVGDEVEFSGTLVTGRDAAHMHLHSGEHDAVFDAVSSTTAGRW
jgi:tartrate dehydratase beta subunit/fumarate hydratase class I family protein